MVRDKIDIEFLIKNVKESPHTMLVVDIDGVIRYCVGLNEVPKNVVEINKLAESRSLKGCSMSFIARDVDYNEEKARKKINNSMEALRYAKKNKLESGINFPKEELGLE